MTKIDRISWYWESEHHGGKGGFNALCDDSITVGRVLYAKEGEAEGGLGLLFRFMSGAFRPDIVQPPLSPAGWYWTATTEARGRWEKGGPFPTPEAARDAATAAFEAGTYLRGDNEPDAPCADCGVRAPGVHWLSCRLAGLPDEDGGDV